MRIIFLLSVTYLLFFIVAQKAEAQFEHKLFRRLAAFPIAEVNVPNAEDAWWQVREVLTKDQRFTVAGKRLLINRGVFSPRKELKPSDAIILAKILDADALILMSLEARKLVMRIYDGENGYLFWQGFEIPDPATPMNDQIVKIATSLAVKFIEELPYHAFQVIDESIGRPLFEEGNEMRAFIFTGINPRIKVGDPVQWIVISNAGGQVFVSKDMKTEIVAEGQIHALKSDRAEVTINRLMNPDLLKENALVRLPKENELAQERQKLETKISNLSNEYLSSQLKKPYEFKKDHDSTVSTLAWILNAAAFVLIAF